MDLILKINDELKQLVGYSSTTPRRIEVVDASGYRLALEIVAVDVLSCAFRELTLFVPNLVGREVGVLKQWAEALSRRVTYLLENIGPVEVDRLGDQVLIRSIPPDRRPQVAKYYEILLSAKGNGTFSLKRFSFEPGQSGRATLDVQLTREVLEKLIQDLVDTVPT